MIVHSFNLKIKCKVVSICLLYSFLNAPFAFSMHEDVREEERDNSALATSLSRSSTSEQSAEQIVSNAKSAKKARHQNRKKTSTDIRNTDTEEVRTRFAPSPTGRLHVGGARTALFNWLFAKKYNGKFILRIDDTDEKRSTEESTNSILSGLRSLGIEWDEGPFFQHSYFSNHVEAAKKLLNDGKAYLCYCSAEELEEKRRIAAAENRVPQYDRKCRDLSPNLLNESGGKAVIRLKMPIEGQTIIEDLILGKVVVENKELDDMILVRSNGLPTYMLSTIVDDYNLKISHVIRGTEHFTNTARQIQLLTALGWPCPKYAHIPLILDPDGSKMSKRKGAKSVEDYKELGYLTEALQSYFLYLGWNQAKKKKVISLHDAIIGFELKDMSKSAIRFDTKKLDSINSYYIAKKDPEALLQEVLSIDEKKDMNLKQVNREILLKAIPSLQKRAITLLDIIHNAYFLWGQRPIVIEDKALEFLNEEMNKEILKNGHDLLSKVENWTDKDLESSLRGLAEEKSLKLVDLIQPLRVALTGRLISPSISEVMILLGKEEVLARISDHIKLD